MKIGVKAVALSRAEGLIEECYAVVYYKGETAPVIDDRHFKNAALIPVSGDIVSEVHQKLVEWGRTSPDPESGCYDKTDFMVIWEDGESYAGRFDMQNGGTDGGETFWESLKSRIAFYACVRRPSHFTDEHWASHCKRSDENGYKSGCQKILDEYELGC